MKGMQIQEMITFNGTPTADKGVLHGVGKGVIMFIEEKERNHWQLEIVNCRHGLKSVT